MEVVEGVYSIVGLVVLRTVPLGRPNYNTVVYNTDGACKQCSVGKLKHILGNITIKRTMTEQRALDLVF